MIKFHDIQQNTDEWLNLRKGLITSSVFGDLFAAKSTATYKNAINKIIFERFTNELPADETYSNAWMQRGHELESEARYKYELETFSKVSNGGFFTYGDWLGGSPDGLVGNDGLIQIKCPKFTTMISYLINKKLPSEYFYQVHGEMLVTGREWNDFVAYHPQLPLLILSVEKDEQVQKEILSKVDEAIFEIKKGLSNIGLLKTQAIESVEVSDN